MARPRSIPDAELPKLWKLKAAGKTVEQIAVRFGVSARSVSRALASLGAASAHQAASGRAGRGGVSTPVAKPAVPMVADELDRLAKWIEALDSKIGIGLSANVEGQLIATMGKLSAQHAKIVAQRRRTEATSEVDTSWTLGKLSHFDAMEERRLAPMLAQIQASSATPAEKEALIATLRGTALVEAKTLAEVAHV